MIGRLIHTYRIEELIGEGGMGTVYRAVDTILGRDVALKMLHPNLISQSTFFERFKNEAQILARLNHPNIATLHNFIQDQGDYFMVMEYIEGIDLEKRLKTRGPLSLNDAIAIAKQAIEGLTHAHHKGVFHRDLKPANLILTPDGQVKIMDFGIAKAVGSEKLTQVNRLVGTLEYIAPELLKGEEPSIQSDLYALGVVVYELLTAKMPFQATTDYDLMQQIINDKPIDIQKRAKEVPKEIWEIIKKLLDKKPKARFNTASDVSIALNGTLQSKMETIKSPTFSLPKFDLKTPKIPSFSLPKFQFGKKQLDKKWLIIGTSVLVALAIIIFFPQRAKDLPQTPKETEVAALVGKKESLQNPQTSGANLINEKEERPAIQPKENEPKANDKKVKEESRDNPKTKTPEEKSTPPPPKEILEEKPREIIREEPKAPTKEVIDHRPQRKQKVTLSGQKITLALANAVSSANAKEGANVKFTVAKPLLVKGVTVFELGTEARGTVSDIRKANALRKEVMEIRIKEVKAANGQWIPVKAAVFREVGVTSGAAVVFAQGQQFIAETTYVTIEI